MPSVQSKLNLTVEEILIEVKKLSKEDFDKFFDETLRLRAKRYDTTFEEQVAEFEKRNSAKISS